MREIDLANKVAVITGGSRGLGKSVAFALARAGARVLIASPQEQVLRAAAEEIAVRCGADRVLAVPADLTKRLDCQRILAEAVRAFGGVDILVNNARRLQRGPGIPDDAYSLPFWRTDPKLWSESVEVNVNALFEISRTLTPHMIARGWGRIINISTSLDTMQRQRNSPYGVTKSAVDAASIIWAQDLGGTGVTVNVLVPGGRVDTEADPNLVSDRPGGPLPVTSMDRMAVWLSSPLSDGVSGERYVGKHWKDGLSIAASVAACREAPVLLTPP